MMKSKVLRLEDLVSQNIQSVSPSLIHFYNEQQIVDLLSQGEDVASFILKHRQELDNKFKAQMEDDRKRIELEAEIIKQKAYTEGKEKIRAEILAQFKDFFDFMDNSKKNIEELKNTMIAEAEDDMVEMTLLIAQKIIASEFTHNKEFFIKFVKSIIRKINEQNKITVQANPADYALLKEHEDILRRELGMVKEFEVVSNSAINKHGVVFEMESGVIDAQIESQIERVRAALANV